MLTHKRHSLSWLGSFATHAALLGGMSVAAAVLPLQLTFQRGRTSIELQATMAAAPRSEPEPTPVKIDETQKFEETKPVEYREADVVVKKQTDDPPKLKKPDATEPETQPTEVALIEIETPMPTETPPEAAVPPPPQRKVVEAQLDLPDAPVISAATAASKAENGADFDEYPQHSEQNALPPYPADARARRQEGRVLLSLQVGVDGAVAQVEIVQSSGFASLDEAAVKAARNWRFTPARRGGVSVAATFNQSVKFYF